MLVSYNHTFYQGYTLRAAAKLYLKALPKEVTVLVSRGHSGTAIASAMLTLAEDRYLRHVIVRKDYEMQHSEGHIKTLSGEVAAIVDDFTASGSTVFTILETVEKRINIKYLIVDGSTIVQSLMKKLSKHLQVIQVTEKDGTWD